MREIPLGPNGLTSCLQNLSRSLRAIWQREGHDLIVSWELDVLKDDQRTVDTSDGVVANPGDDGVRRRFARVRHGYMFLQEQRDF